jgi:hypothetical protein
VLSVPGISNVTTINPNIHHHPAGFVIPSPQNTISPYICITLSISTTGTQTHV